MDALIQVLARAQEAIIARYREEIAALRTSRASPALVENVLVASYGTTLPVKQLASLSLAGPNVITVQPWDKEMLPQIERAIRDANLGVSPVIEGGIIRVTLPPLTEERRKELVKLLGKKTEDAKIAFRLARDQARREIQKLFEEKKISENDKYRANERLQKEVDTFARALEDAFKKKEAEILTV